MFVIGEAMIDERIAHERFACDLSECKGACCTLHGGRGAPLEETEIRELELAAEAAQKYLSSYHRHCIARHGMFEGSSGNRATVCIDNRDCVFVFYEESIARCSLEKAYLLGETGWRKPISCHLFPIRMAVGGERRLRYEMIPECKAGVERGKKENIPIYRFLEAPLKRTFGSAWCEEFLTECARREGIKD